MTAKREPVPAAHVGKPDCDTCGGSGDNGALRCPSCGGNGATDWPAFLANARGVCDICEWAGNRHQKPVHVDETMAVCAGCYSRQHSEYCGCGKAVATKRQVAEARGLRSLAGGAP